MTAPTPGPTTLPAIHRPVRALVLAILAWLALAFGLSLFPQLDIALASRFFTPTPCAEGTSGVCGSFAASLDPLLVTIRRVFYFLPHAAAAILILSAALIWRRARAFTPMLRRISVCLAGLLLGPILLVNGLLKAQSGRPRPYETDLFGGAHPFVPAGDFSGACTSNCSFISGEAAGAAWLLCLVLLVPGRFRLPAGIMLAVISLATAGLRVVFGGHYASDAVLGYASSPVMLLLAAVIIGWPHVSGRRAQA